MISADDLITLLETYGYLAIVVGTILEGETILVLGGVLSYWGILELPEVMLMAFIGSMAGDQFFFYFGRYQGGWFLSKNKRLKGRVKKIHRLLQRFHNLIMVGFRFLYGCRMITPILLGLDRNLKGGRFLILNGTGAMIWAVLVASVGYCFAETLGLIFKDVKKIQMIFLLVLFLIVGLIWILRLFHRRRKREEIIRMTTNGSGKFKE